MKSMYFIETIEIKDQKINDNMPNILEFVSASILLFIAKISLIAYSGLVPISPKTTPSAPKQRTKNFES